MNVYVIGSLSCEDEIKRVADKYARLGCNVKYVEPETGYLQDPINKCFRIIAEWADLVVVVPKSCCLVPLITIGDGVKYEMAFADFMNKPVVIYWKGAYHDQSGDAEGCAGRVEEDQDLSIDRRTDSNH